MYCKNEDKAEEILSIFKVESIKDASPDPKRSRLEQDNGETIGQDNGKEDCMTY